MGAGFGFIFWYLIFYWRYKKYHFVGYGGAVLYDSDAFPFLGIALPLHILFFAFAFQHAFEGKNKKNDKEKP